MVNRTKPSGECLLTRTHGRFVKSHIIPRFLADKALGQAHRIQFGGGRPQLLFNSWVDRNICGVKGEARLAEIDTAAAAIFRKWGLSWRHFPLTDLARRQAVGLFDSELISIPMDSKVLRLFFLSLLWRSAVSSRFEFAEVILDSDSIERLRCIVLGEIEPNDEDFPSVLLLLTNAGRPQVLCPLAQVIDLQAMGFDYPSVPIYRFFLDGLIVHIGRKPNDRYLLDAWGNRVVGSGPELVLIGRPYEGSSQEDNLQRLQTTLHQEHPDAAIRIYRKLSEIDEAGK